MVLVKARAYKIDLLGGIKWVRFVHLRKGRLSFRVAVPLRVVSGKFGELTVWSENISWDCVGLTGSREGQSQSRSGGSVPSFPGSVEEAICWETLPTFTAGEWMKFRVTDVSILSGETLVRRGGLWNSVLGVLERLLSPVGEMGRSLGFWDVDVGLGMMLLGVRGKTSGVQVGSGTGMAVLDVRRERVLSSRVWAVYICQRTT